MKFKHKVEVLDNEEKTVDGEVVIEFKNKNQRDAFLLGIMKSPICWEYLVEGNMMNGTDKVTIYGFSWGENLVELGKILQKIDGSYKWEVEELED